MRFQFIKNCFRKDCLVNKDYRKYNIIDNCKYSSGLNKVIHYTDMSIEIIPLEYLKVYKY